MKRFNLLISMLLVLSLVLVACGGDKTPTQEKPADTASDSTGTGESVKLTVYSNSLSDGRSEWLAEQAKGQGFDLEFVDAGGGDIFNRLLAEKNAPLADITFGLDESMFFSLVDSDVLVPFTPVWAAELPADSLVGDGFFHAITEQRIFMVYNEEFMDAADAPTKWEDLGNNPEYKNIYRIPGNLSGGTNQKSILSILLQYQDPNGELGISEQGWEEVGKFLSNGYNVPEGVSSNDLFKSGELPISFDYISGIPKKEAEFEFKMTPINPPYGAIAMREQIGIINKGDKDYSDQERFVDWFGSAEVQSAWANEFGSLPVNKKALDGVQPRIKELADATSPMDVDWNFVREHLNEWIEKVELELYPY